MQYTGVARSVNHKILFETNSRRIFEFAANVQERSIPGYGFDAVHDSCPKLPLENYAYKVEITETEHDHYIRYDGENKIRISFPSSTYVANDVEILLLYLFSQQHQMSSVYCTFGVGLQNVTDKGILLIGDFGAGKSVVEMVLLQQGYKWIGNDRILISAGTQGTIMSEGSIPIRLRNGTLTKYFPDLVPKGIAVENPWGIFQSFNPFDLGFQQSQNVVISHIFRVQVCPIKDKDCTCGSLVDIFGRFTPIKLYQFISYYVAANSMVHLGLMNFYPSFDTQEYADRRLRLAEKTLGQVESYEVVGNLHWVADKIREITERGGK